MQCGNDCGPRRRLLGFFISTIVLGLLTKGFKISVRKVAFLTLQGIKVEVPERGVMLEVEEISVVTNLQGAKWFTLQVHRPRVELDLQLAIDRVQQARLQALVSVSEAARRNVSNTPAPSARSAEAPGASAAASGARAAPGWVKGVMKVVVPPLADMLLRAAAASLELVVTQSGARITVPMMGHVCLALQQLAVSFNTTSVTTSAPSTPSTRSKEAGQAANKSKPALVLSVSSHRLLISQNPKILTTSAAAAVAGARRAGGGGSGGGACGWQRAASVHASMREQSGQLDSLAAAKSPGDEGVGMGADNLHGGVLLAVDASLFSCVLGVRVGLDSGGGVDAKIYRVLFDVGYVETDIQESLLCKALEAQALIASALRLPQDASVRRAQAPDAGPGPVPAEDAWPARGPPPKLLPSGQVQRAFGMVPTECVFALRGAAGVLHMGKESESAPAYVNPILDPRDSAALEFKLTPVRLKMHKAVRQAETTEAGRRGEETGGVEAGRVPGFEGQVFVDKADADSLTLSCASWSPEADSDDAGCDDADSLKRPMAHGFSLRVAETREAQIVHSFAMEGLCCNATLLLPASLLAPSQARNDRTNTDEAASISLASSLAAMHCKVEPLGKSGILDLLDNLMHKQAQLLPDSPDTPDRALNARRLPGASP